MTEIINQTTLTPIYGTGAAAQTARYEQAITHFIETYGPGQIFIFRAPGRVNLIGEHTDYNHGYVMPFALDKDTLLLARPRPDHRVQLTNLEPEFPPFSFDISPAIPPGPAATWENYPKAAAQMLAHQRTGPITGLDGLIAGQPSYGVPRGAGVSSSTSLTVVTAIALAHFNHWQPDPTTLARHCAEAEWYVGTRGGVLDQFSLLLTRQNHALFLDCRPDAAGQYKMEHAPLPPGYQLLVADSNVRHRNVGGGYNYRVAACRAGVGLLRPHYPHITHLRDVQDIPWADLVPHLPAEITVADLTAQHIDLGDLPGLTATTTLKVRARCRHVWTENDRVKAAITALQTGDVPTLGRLLNEAHISARDDYDISCPELETLVTAAREVDGVTGARLTGAGWGGCIIALVPTPAVPAFETHVSQRYHADTGLTPTIFACRAAPAAGLVGVVEAA